MTQSYDDNVRESLMTTRCGSTYSFSAICIDVINRVNLSGWMIN